MDKLIQRLNRDCYGGWKIDYFNVYSGGKCDVKAGFGCMCVGDVCDECFRIIQYYNKNGEVESYIQKDKTLLAIETLQRKVDELTEIVKRLENKS